MTSAYLPAAIAALSMLGLSTTLAAQTATPAPEAKADTGADTGAKEYVQIENDTLLVGPFNVSVDELDEFEVFDVVGKKIGAVEEVLADASGAPVAVVIEREDQAETGEDDIVVSLDRLELVGANLQIDMSREELESSPRWED